MRASERVWLIGRDFAGVLPRSRTALSSTDDWNPFSPNGIRRLGEVVLDEVALSGMTLTAPPPKLERTAASCLAAADELSSLGVDGANAEPEPLRIANIQRRRFGPVSYEQMTFEHDPRLPAALAAAGLQGPATAVVHLCRADAQRRPWLVWMHGAGQGQPTDLLFSRAQRIQKELGFNVALPIQPGHGSRRGAWPTYPNMDPLANVARMLRVVSEVRALVRWLAPQASAIAVSGVSLGSPVAALVSHLEPVDAVAVYIPMLDLNAMIARHLGRWGSSVRDIVDLLQSDTVALMGSAVAPLSVTPTPPPGRRLIVAASHDRMAMPEPALALHEHWGGRLHWHDGSHVGELFSRRMQAVTEEFLRELTER